MSNSVVFGNIPGTTGMYTAEQVDEQISGLERIVNASPEEVSGVINAITNVTSGLVTKDELADLVKASCGELIFASGMDSGCGVTGVYYKNRNTGEFVRLFDASMVCGIESGETVFTNGMLLLSQLSMSGYDAHKIEGGVDAAMTLWCGLDGSNSGLYSAVNALVSAWSSGSNPVMLPSGTSFCDAVRDCISGDYVSENDLCEHVHACISGEFIPASGVDLSGLSAAISALSSAVDGIGSGLAEIKEAVSGLPDEIVDAIEAAALEARQIPEEDRTEAQRKIIAADDKMDKPLATNAVADMDRKIEAGVDTIADSLSDASDALSNTDPETPSISDTAPDDIAEEASEAAQTVSSEASAVEAIGDFVP